MVDKIIEEKSALLNVEIDIKKDALFKYIFTSDTGVKYLSRILSYISNIDYKELKNNIELYPTELIRSNIEDKSSFCDIVYRYKNYIFIIEMNYEYSDLINYKNHFYMLHKQVTRSNNKNMYGKYMYTYLINIDNYDILKKRRLVNRKDDTSLIYKEELRYDYKNKIIYKNIRNIHINLKYIKNSAYKYSTLTNIERDCIIFIEIKEKLLRKYITNEEIGGVIMLYKLFLKMDERRIQKEMRDFMKEHYKEAGLLEGREEGLVEGENNAKISIAKSLKKKNYSLKEIMEITGLSKDKINML